MVDWVHVQSSAIRKIGYEQSTRRMFIDFEDSDPYYTYCGVPKGVFHSFVNAGSVGVYYHQYIKDHYDC